MGGCVVTNPNKEPTMATKGKQRLAVVTDGHLCPHYENWTGHCLHHRISGKPTCDDCGIPAWCPLPVAKEEKPANTKPRRAKK